jgi:hypothetical protein
MVSFTPLSIYPCGNSHQFPLERRLGVPRAALDELFNLTQGIYDYE